MPGEFRSIGKLCEQLLAQLAPGLGAGETKQLAGYQTTSLHHLLLEI